MPGMWALFFDCGVVVNQMILVAGCFPFPCFFFFFFWISKNLFPKRAMPKHTIKNNT